MNWKQKLFESYNEALVSGCDLYVEKRGKEAANGLENGAYEEYTEESVRRWNNMPLDIMGCLKEYFLKYEKVVLGASNLAEYGDSRAIPALRGYAQRHMALLDKETFYEIKSAVERLGGNMDDLNV